MRKLSIILLLIIYLTIGCAPVGVQEVRNEISKGYSELDNINDPVEKQKRLEELQKQEQDLQEKLDNGKKAAIIGSSLLLLGVAGGLVASGAYISGASPNVIYVEPYFRDDGTYVQGHYRTLPDGDKSNNWSTKGNINPYTGEKGYD